MNDYPFALLDHITHKCVCNVESGKIGCFHHRHRLFWGRVFDKFPLSCAGRINDYFRNTMVPKHSLSHCYHSIAIAGIARFNQSVLTDFISDFFKLGTSPRDQNYSVPIGTQAVRNRLTNPTRCPSNNCKLHSNFFSLSNYFFNELPDMRTL